MWVKKENIYLQAMPPKMTKKALKMMLRIFFTKRDILQVIKKEKFLMITQKSRTSADGAKNKIMWKTLNMIQEEVKRETRKIVLK